MFHNIIPKNILLFIQLILYFMKTLKESLLDDIDNTLKTR